jgi:hypothetical protein
MCHAQRCRLLVQWYWSHSFHPIGNAVGCGICILVQLAKVPVRFNGREKLSNI